MKLLKPAVVYLGLMIAVLVGNPLAGLKTGLEPVFAQSSSSTISAEEAIRIARSVVPDASVEEVELERKNGRWVWKVEFANDIEVKIDARAGKILDIDDD